MKNPQGGGGGSIARGSQEFDLEIGNAVADLGRFRFGTFAGGSIQIINGQTVTTLTFLASARTGGDMDPV